MAAVEIRRDDYEDGVLPQVCAFTGARAEVLVDHRSHRGAGAGVLFFLLLGPVGLIIVLVVDRLMRVDAKGLVPMSRQALADRAAVRHRWKVIALGGLVATAAGVAIAVTAGAQLQTMGVVVAAGGLLVAVLAYVGPALTGVRGRPDRTGRSVALSGVAPEFARAYRAQESCRAEARRAAHGAPTTSAV